MDWTHCRIYVTTTQLRQHSPLVVISGITSPQRDGRVAVPPEARDTWFQPRPPHVTWRAPPKDPQGWDMIKNNTLTRLPKKQKKLKGCEKQVGGLNLHKGSGAQNVTHLLQDLFLKNVPGHCSLQIQNEWISKPAGRQKQWGFFINNNNYYYILFISRIAQKLLTTTIQPYCKKGGFATISIIHGLGIFRGVIFVDLNDVPDLGKCKYGFRESVNCRLSPLLIQTSVGGANYHGDSLNKSSAQQCIISFQ